MAAHIIFLTEEVLTPIVKESKDDNPISILVLGNMENFGEIMTQRVHIRPWVEDITLVCRQD
jgi:hypothetical protein